jgi:hypothetical protein
MGKPLMIQKQDNEKIEELKERLGMKTKIEVLRSALVLLEEKLSKEARINRWKKASKIVGTSSMEVLKEFQTEKRFENLS